MSYVDTMTHHYAIAALWSTPNYLSEEEDSTYGENLDDDFDVEDIHPDSYAGMREDCESFVTSARDGEWNGTGTDLLGDMSPDQAGHDLWLTRNGHGVGFWDRGLGERGDQLTRIAKPFGEVHLYVGDDGRVHAGQ